MPDAVSQPLDVSVEAYLVAIADPVRQADARTLVALMSEISGEPAKMWGTAMVGFGRRKYTYSSGHCGETMLIGFAARKSAFTLYGSSSLEDYDDLLAKLGKHTTGKGCLYVKRLSDIDPAVLRDFLSRQFATSSALPEHIETVSSWDDRKKALGR